SLVHRGTVEDDAHDRESGPCAAGFQSRSATQPRTDSSAFGSAEALVPPACAMSGRPPPLPPTCEATKFTSSPAFTLAMRSWVTPAMRLTLLSPSALASTIALDLSLSLSLSIV